LVAVAAVIGGIQALSLVGEQLGLCGALWDMIGSFDANFNEIGSASLAFFIVAWIVSLTIYRYVRVSDLKPITLQKARIGGGVGADDCIGLPLDGWHVPEARYWIML
jgi:hypothetical protein